MRKLLLLSLSLVLLSSAAAAITVESPESRVHLDSAVSIQVSGASSPVDYSLNGAENKSCECIENKSAIVAPDGENTLTVYDIGDGTVDSDSVTFTVDTAPPSVSSRTPEGTTYTLSPELRIEYSDVSRVEEDHVDVRLDGEAVDGSVDQGAFNHTSGELTEGTHTVSYNIPDEHWKAASNHNATGSWTFTLPIEPVLSGASPTGVTGDAPEVAVTARDPSGIDREASRIELSGPEDSRVEWGELENLSEEVENGVTFRHGFEGLEDGEYTVTAHVEDAEGNAAEDDWAFTVDTTPPELSFHSHLTGDVVKDTEKLAFNVTDLTAVETVNLTVGGVSAEATSAGGLYTADVDTTLIDDGEAALRVTAEDSSGNAVTERISLTVDNNEPVVEDVELYPEPVQGGLEISALVRDESTKIIGARYRLKRPGSDETLESGRLEAVVGEYDSLEEEVQAVIDLTPLDLASGNYTALLRAEDAAGHQYGWFGGYFEVDNSLQPRIEIEGRMFRQEIGTASTFNFRVSNTGEVDELVSPRVESELDAEVSPAKKRVQAGETKQFELEVHVPRNRSYLGNHSLTLHAEGLSSDALMATEVIGQPISEEKQEIEARFQALEEEFSGLNESRQDWSFGEEMEEQFQATAELVSEVERLLDEGRYSLAEQRLEEAEENFKETESSFTGQVTRARLGNLASTALKLLALLAVIGIVYGAYRLIPPEGGYSQERGYTHRPGGRHPLLVELEGRWKRFREKRKERSGKSRDEKSVGRWEGYDRD